MWYETNKGELINLDRITLISLAGCKIRFDEPAYFEDYVDHNETFETNEEAQKKFEQLKKKLLLSNSTIMLGTPKLGQPAGQLICGK